MFKYSFVLQWSEEDEEYVAVVPEFPGVSALAETPEEATSQAKEVAESWLATLKEEGRSLPEPRLLATFSGQLRLRMPRSLHSKLAQQAELEGVSLNTYLVGLLSGQAERVAATREIAESHRLLGRAEALLHVARSSFVETHRSINPDGISGEGGASMFQGGASSMTHNTEVQFDA